MMMEIFFYRLGEDKNLIKIFSNPLDFSVSFNWQSKGHENTPKMPKYLEQHQNPPDLLVVSGSR